MEIKEQCPIQKNGINNENSKISEKYPKFLEKSDQFYFETLSKNEKLYFILSFALIEDKNIIQKIIVSVKPYAMKNKNNSNMDDKENYIEEIKRALSRVSYREKFSVQDFKDVSDIYANDKNLNMKKIFDDMVKSIKEKKARIKINKYHMIFNYYINNDFNDLNNSIMLCLDNEIESSILEKYYENTFRKLFKAKYNENNDINTVVINNDSNKNNEKVNKENNSNKKMEISEYDNDNNESNNNNNIDNNDSSDKTDYDSTHNNNINENAQHDNIINKENKIHISPLISIDNYDDKDKQEEKKEIISKDIINVSQKESKDENKNINEKIEKKKIFNLIIDYNNNIGNDKLNKSENDIISKSSSKSKKEKTKRRSRKQALSKEKEKNENSIEENDNKNNKQKESVSKDVDTITKDFLYEEYKLSKNNINVFTEYNDNDNKTEKEKEKKEEKKMIEDSDEDESWGESLFFDKDEIKPSEIDNEEKEKEKNNLIGNKKSRTKSPIKKKSGKKSVIKISKLEKENNEKIKNKENKEEKKKEGQQIIVLNEDEEETNKKNKNINRKINNENNNNESFKNKKVINTNNTNISLYNKIINPSKNPLYQKNITILQKYMSELSSIINSPLEIFILKEKIEPYNKIYFKLVYTSQKFKDDYDSFKSAVMDNYRHLILVKTEKNIRFAIYLNEKLFSSKGKQGQEIIDMMSFIYSFEKKTFFVPNERIVCFTQSPFKPYLFKLSDYSIYIKNNYKNEKHYLLKASKVFKINNLYLELNKGEPDFNISILEVYRVEIPE